MISPAQSSARAAELNLKVARLFQKRTTLAWEHLTDRLHQAWHDGAAQWLAQTHTPWTTLFDASQYALDAAQRSILFWDTLRQRGDIFIEHERSGKPPVLHFKHELVLDARTFERPVNYALLRILPPKEVTVDPRKRPYLIIDPRAGHGPGIGGFKDDSQVGVALRAGHPVYFVVFFPQPEPGQTLLDVTAAEQRFVKKVRELHPDSPKPVIVGNCQGGWAAMMLAAADPEDTGPVVINGAPMSYWGGAWKAGEGDNPMRYAAGLLGGTWLASLTADLGNGIFDGAWLVQNFENLNPANTYWDKYYHLYANVDTEPPRFLEFERWWGGMYLLNREEIEWITRNLFVGNKLWSGEVRSGNGRPFDLRDIRSPIVLFASLGDNITPPQQAFNWIADVYGSTEEIKARGQVIVGLLHQDVGHLGIFVSGRVAKREHAQIVSVLKSIEALPPGLYGMQIEEQPRENGGVEYEVRFVEHRLEDVTRRLNRFQRADEKPFEAVEQFAGLNQRAYELFLRPWVQAAATEFGGRLGRFFHPLRAQRWMISGVNPWLAWLGSAARAVQSQRKPVAPGSTLRSLERAASAVISASLDYGRELRDACSEAIFYQLYGGWFALEMAEARGLETTEAGPRIEGRDLPVVKEALAAMTEGGYAEALARVFALLARERTPLTLAQLHAKRELAETYAPFLPTHSAAEQRRIRGEQDLIVRYEPEQALETLPRLLQDPADAARLGALLDRLAHDGALWQFQPTQKQIALLDRIRSRIPAPQPRRATAQRGTAVAPRRPRNPKPHPTRTRHGIAHQRHLR